MRLGNKILAIIPARGGSKGIPGKNIVSLLGKPLIAWTIEAAKACSFIDKLVVSTDDTDIASISKQFGVEVPFIRPGRLATDQSNATEVILHCIEWFEKKHEYYDLILFLQPTSPLRTGLDIKNAIEQLFKLNAKSIISVCETEHHPFWANQLPEDLCLKDFIKSNVNVNRQELPKFYRLNGALYLSYIDYFKNNNSFWGMETYAYIMNKTNSVDIDSMIDLRLAEILMSEKYGINGDSK